MGLAPFASASFLLLSLLYSKPQMSSIKWVCSVPSGCLHCESVKKRTNLFLVPMERLKASPTIASTRTSAASGASGRTVIYICWTCIMMSGNGAPASRGSSITVLKPVPGSGSRTKCAQFRGSSDAKHVSSWFQPWATLWPTCHMLVPTSLLQSVECSTECKNSIFHCTIGFNKYKSSLASGASPQTPPGGLFLPPGPPPPAWVHAAHRHGMVSPRKVWFQRPCSSLVLVPEEVVEPASGR